MLRRTYAYLSGVVLLISFATTSMNALSFRKSDELLQLVPPGAEIVSGIADAGNRNSVGGLLIVTADSNRDFDDALALLGVDSTRSITEAMAVISSSKAGFLDERLLLLEGRFDRGLIFKSALHTGNQTIQLDGEELVVVKPFRRDRKGMADIRWLVILKDKILLFGVPALVEKALTRFRSHEPPNSILLKRLGELNSDVDSWSIIALTPSAPGQRVLLDERLAFLRQVLQNAEEFAVGIHYAQNARVSFSIHAPDVSRIPDSLTLAAFAQAGLSSSRRLELQNTSGDQQCISGSFMVRRQEFDEWLMGIQQNRSSLVPLKGQGP